jgi:nucleoside-diphosphate-sugar epimerase
VAVTTSLVDPLDDFTVNAQGTLTLLEALRALDEPPPLLFTSTNKVYGDLADVPMATDGQRWAPADAAVAAAGSPRRARSTSTRLRLLEGRGRPVRVRLRALVRACRRWCSA